MLYRNNIEKGGEGKEAVGEGGKDSPSLGGSITSWGTKHSVSEQMSLTHERLSPRSLKMNEFDPNENMFDWRVVAKKQAAYSILGTHTVLEHYSESIFPHKRPRK